MPRRLLVQLSAGLLATVLVVVGAVAYVAHTSSSTTPALLRVSGLPRSVSTEVATLMELSPLPARPAPNFTFVDQKGTTISLTSLRGHPVVLNFMDSHCTDICPIVSAELVMADRQLARYAKDTVFLAVNVNQYNTSVASVEAFSANHGLNSIPTWHFLTGPVPALEATWRAYGIAVHAPSPTADVVHTSATYFIDPKGNERYIAAPAVNHTKKGKAYLPPVDISAWARGIAEVANSLAK